MRFVDPTIEPIPAALNYSTIKADLNASLASPFTALGKIYKGTVKVGNTSTNTVVEALLRKYKHKCGYCESYESDPNVEHHRPIGSVSGRNPANTRGYYWLAYEWSNLVAACPTCNGRKYKGVKFPISNGNGNVAHPQFTGNTDLDSFAYESVYNTNEGPLILHPEFCTNPEIHFRFDKEGYIYHLTPEGNGSISVYGLDRRTLRVNRKNIYSDYLATLKTYVEKRFRLGNNSSHEEFAEEIGSLLGLIVNRRNDPNRSFTLFVKYMLDHLEEFFIHVFPVPIIQQELKTAFQQALVSMGVGIVLI